MHSQEQICITAVEQLRAATLDRQKAALSSCRAVIIELMQQRQTECSRRDFRQNSLAKD
jgi:hypothetical protein